MSSNYTRSFDAYFGPFRDAAEEFRDAVAPGSVPASLSVSASLVELAAVRRALDKFAERKAEIENSPDFTPDGRAKALRALVNEREADGADLLPKMRAATEAIAVGIGNLELAADGGMTWDPKLKGYLKTDPTRTPEEMADEREARDHWRTLPETERRELYRRYVVENDPRARWLERDPVGTLVTERDREWAKTWRIEHSEFAAQITVLRAKLRSYSLLLDAAERGFRAVPLGV